MKFITMTAFLLSISLGLVWAAGPTPMPSTFDGPSTINPVATVLNFDDREGALPFAPVWFDFSCSLNCNDANFACLTNCGPYALNPECHYDCNLAECFCLQGCWNGPGTQPSCG